MICNKVEKCIEEQLVNQKTTACVNEKPNPPAMLGRME